MQQHGVVYPFLDLEILNKLYLLAQVSFDTLDGCHVGILSFSRFG